MVTEKYEARHLVKAAEHIIELINSVAVLTLINSISQFLYKCRQQHSHHVRYYKDQGPCITIYTLKISTVLKFSHKRLLILQTNSVLSAVQRENSLFISLTTHLSISFPSHKRQIFQ